MDQAGDFLNGATIEYGSRIPDDDGGSLELFGINLPSGESYWFAAKKEWAENGNDYALLIGNFGAIGRLSWKYRSFNKTQIMEIKAFLEKYFHTENIRYFSEIMDHRKPLAFHYRDKWIIEGNGELYDNVTGERIDG